MHEEIGNTAGTIWSALHARGEMTLPELKKHIGAKTPVFDWAIGWLSREGNIVLSPEKRTFKIRLK